MSDHKPHRAYIQQWWLSNQGVPVGPYDEALILNGLRTGTIASETYACMVGGQTWKRLHEWPAFAGACATTYSPPGPSPTSVPAGRREPASRPAQQAGKPVAGHQPPPPARGVPVDTQSPAATGQADQELAELIGLNSQTTSSRKSTGHSSRAPGIWHYIALIIALFISRTACREGCRQKPQPNRQPASSQQWRPDAVAPRPVGKREAAAPGGSKYDGPGDINYDALMPPNAQEPY